MSAAIAVTRWHTWERLWKRRLRAAAGASGYAAFVRDWSARGSGPVLLAHGGAMGAGVLPPLRRQRAVKYRHCSLLVSECGGHHHGSALG